MVYRCALSLVSFIFCPLAETSRDPEDYDLYTISADQYHQQGQYRTPTLILIPLWKWP
jgi:hypothetical protein